jgi:predicted glycogen debranching enzyme
MITFNREICCNVGISAVREWLVTNGIGGYASGTVAGMLTRRYHGLLIAALNPPVDRTLLISKLDETATYMGRSYAFAVNRWRYGYVDPDGYRWLRRFQLEGTTPVWVFPLGNARLQKRVWMAQGANTTYVRYDLVDGGDEPVTLEVRALVNYRSYHANTHAGDWHMQVDAVERGVRVQAFEEAVPFYVLSDRAEVTVRHEWIRDFYLSVEAYRGYDAFDDNLDVGLFQATLAPGQSLTFVASTDPAPNLDGEAAYAARQAYEAKLIAKADAPSEATVRQLILAADQFIVQRPSLDIAEGRTIIAGYPWFADWGRDTMISLSGLTLTTGRPEVARRILRTYARFVDQGMLPNRFPDVGAEPEYNTVDATLWYFEALRAYYIATQDDALLQELFPVLEDIIAWHRRGTRYQIHVDPEDGLLYAGEPGVQLTWMDAKVGDWVVTPRIGKPVEVNALWYNALQVMAAFARCLKVSDASYVADAERAHRSFTRFWNPERGYCYDILDGPEGNDPALRPNQLFAVSLGHDLLTPEQQRAVVDVCERRLLTPRGLRSLAYTEPAYVGHYGGDQTARDAAYHQGTAWGWLIGPFIVAHLRAYQDPVRAREFLEPFYRNLEEHGVGSISEIFDGDLPYAPRGCIAQAWSVGEVLRVGDLLEQGEIHPYLPCELPA